jgi:hypothetical protein
MHIAILSDSRESEERKWERMNPLDKYIYHIVCRRRITSRSKRGKEINHGRRKT